MFYGTTTQQSQALKWFVEVITYYQDWARAKAVQHNATRLGGDNENNRWKPPPQGSYKQYTNINSSPIKSTENGYGVLGYQYYNM